MPELITINVVIADRTYRLKINPTDEELIRTTTKLINEKIIEFKTNFAGKDLQDYVSMALLWFATEQNKQGGSSLIEQQGLKDKLLQLEQILDRGLL
jgi:cell division protein ZapA